MQIRQNAEIHSAVLHAGQSLNVDEVKRVNYVHLIKGEVNIGEHTVKAGDALVFEENAVIQASEDSQMIWFNLP